MERAMPNQLHPNLKQYEDGQISGNDDLSPERTNNANERLKEEKQDSRYNLHSDQEDGFITAEISRADNILAKAQEFIGALENKNQEEKKSTVEQLKDDIENFQDLNSEELNKKLQKIKSVAEYIESSL